MSFLYGIPSVKEQERREPLQTAHRAEESSLLSQLLISPALAVPAAGLRAKSGTHQAGKAPVPGWVFLDGFLTGPVVGGGGGY